MTNFLSNQQKNTPKKKNADIVITSGQVLLENNPQKSANEPKEKAKKPRAKKKKSVMFVCTGNTCRSAMAQYIFEFALKKRGLDGEYCATSSGISASVGSEMMPNAKKALDTLSIPYKKHKSKQTTQSLAMRSFLIVCMTSTHKMALDSVGAKSITVSQIVGGGDVQDPYGMDEYAYLKTAEALLYASDEIIDYLTKNTNETKTTQN